MKNSAGNERKVESAGLAKRGTYSKRYIIALLLLAILVTFSEFAFRHQFNKSVDDTRLANVAGRQRMETQQLAKNVLLAMNVAGDARKRESLVAAQACLDRLKTTQHKIRQGDEDLRISAHDSPEHQEIHGAIDESYANLTHLLDRLIEHDSKNGATLALNEDAAFAIVAKCDELLLNHEELVRLFQDESDYLLEQMNVTILAFYVATILLLILEGLFLFRPTAQLISSQLKSLQKAKSEADLQTQAAKESDELKTAFLSNLSHEIRTPLNGIMGASSLLHDRAELNPENRELVKVIRRCSDNVLGRIESVINLAQLETGAMAVNEDEFEIEEAVYECFRRVKATAKDKGVRFEYDAASQRGLKVKGDRIKIQQVLRQLGDNAIRFTERGQISVRSVIERNDNMACIRVEVEDTGSGFDANQFETLKKSFSQGDNSLTRKHDGLGIGLAIVAQTCQMLDAELQFKSEIGVGTTATVIFNLGIVETVLQAEEEEAEEKRDLKGCKVLLVEDNVVNQMITKKIVEAMGCEVVVAVNGQEATEFWQRDSDFDLVLMDLQMPIMDGFSATEAIRQSGESGLKIPIIALTANVHDEDKVRCRLVGMNDFLTKPIRSEELERSLSAAIAKGA